MGDIRKEYGVTVSRLASGIWQLPDDVFYEFFMELAKCRQPEHEADT